MLRKKDSKLPKSILETSKYLKNFISSVTILDIVITEILSLYLRGKLLTKEEKHNHDFLKWSLIKRGLRGINLNDYLTKNENGQFICKKDSLIPISQKENKNQYLNLRDQITSFLNIGVTLELN